MIGMSVDVSGREALERGLREISTRVSDQGSLHAIAGHVWVFQELPRVFREKGPGWARPKRRIGSPLQDTGRMRDSWAYSANDQDVRIGTKVRYAGVHQGGRVITPRSGRKFLLIPLSPPLSITEVRAWPLGKAAIAARYPGSFFLIKGPEGPGIYRKTSRTAFTVGSRVRHVVIERIAAAVRSVKIDSRPMAKKSDRLLRSIGKAWVLWIARGEGMYPASDGTPDSGPRGGQRE